MKPIHTFVAIPKLPPQLEPLRDLAYNLRWSWNHATIGLFRRLDSDLWETTGHNPVLMLGRVDQDRLAAILQDDGFMSHLEGVNRHMQVYLQGGSTWFAKKHLSEGQQVFAYFSFEFGVTEALSIFAGGLGVLAGDMMKSASDLGVPLVGVGLLYQQGYLNQYLNEAGWQQEAYKENDFDNLPILLVRDEAGQPLMVATDYPGRSVYAQIWRAQVGRCALYLLDTNISANQPDDRAITRALYGGDREMRMKQEILLGIGGYRALETLGLDPVVLHMNEGHSAFAALERTRRLMKQHGVSFAEGREAASAGVVFTTHTAVPAGHDYFAPDLVERYLGEYARSLGLTWPDFMALGRVNPNQPSEPFCMTVLALKMAASSNSVSRLHGQVSRQMFQSLWPGVPVEEIPIAHVTNGTHFRSWISQEMDQLYDRYLGLRWREEPSDPSAWQRVESIPAEELWRTHERRRERLVAYARQRLVRQLEKRGASQAMLLQAEVALDPKALTIGFARRFATYKRAALLLKDPPRLERILNDPERPVQLIFAGKAHPHDTPGKELIQKIVSLAQEPAFRRRVVFVEDYDMAVARYLVQGSDVWLNTPVRPHEASGTSGMKAIANGVLHLSTLDGWWDEAYVPEAGWAVGRGEQYDDPEQQEQLEAEALYGVLERDVVPEFYERGVDGLPRRWIGRMKASIGRLCPVFNSNRMVAEYIDCFYLPAAQRVSALQAEGLQRSKALASWKQQVRSRWPQVKVVETSGQAAADIEIGTELVVSARVYLGGLKPDDVSVQLYLGRVDPDGEIIQAEIIPMFLQGPAGDGVYLYEISDVTCCQSGRHGYTVRVLPRHPDLETPFLPGQITWA